MDRPWTNLLPLAFCIWNKIHPRKASHIKPGFLPPKHNPFTDFHLHANNISWYVQGVICCLWQYKFVKIRDGNLGLRVPSKMHLKHIPCCINAATIIRYGQTWPHNWWGAGGMVVVWPSVSTYTVVVSTPKRVKPKNHQTTTTRRNWRRILKEF